MATPDETEMQRLEAEIRETRARVDSNIRSVQGFVDAWRDFIGMFTVANARGKAENMVESVVDDVAERAESVLSRIKDLLKR